MTTAKEITGNELYAVGGVTKTLDEWADEKGFDRDKMRDLMRSEKHMIREKYAQVIGRCTYRIYEDTGTLRHFITVDYGDKEVETLSGTYEYLLGRLKDDAMYQSR
jgi:hypothetical protein